MLTLAPQTWLPLYVGWDLLVSQMGCPVTQGSRCGIGGLRLYLGRVEGHLCKRMWDVTEVILS